MSKITVYVPDEIARRARGVARSERISVSRWIADVVKEKLDSNVVSGVSGGRRVVSRLSG